MIAEEELAEYLAEIRKHACSSCVERPPGGPPCVTLGKQCGVEMHLPELIDGIHQVKSGSIEPYLSRTRLEVCGHCTLQHSDKCPCPIDYLAVLIVEAVEEVDRRRAAWESVL
jgi:hypothetical protein